MHQIFTLSGLLWPTLPDAASAGLEGAVRPERRCGRRPTCQAARCAPTPSVENAWLPAALLARVYLLSIIGDAVA